MRAVAVAERIIEEDLSAWTKDQELLIRKALLEYKSRSQRKGGFSWQDVQRDVEDVTGVSMGGKDHFRQYIAGTRPATDDPARRRAIAAFVTHPDVDLMSLKEFLEPASRFHAPRRLLEYLRTDLDPVDVQSPIGSLCGSYRLAGPDQPQGLSIRLQLHRLDGSDWILRVREECEEVRAPDMRSNHKYDARRSSSGWCVLTPEDNLLFFLKEDRYGQNHYYHLVSDADVWAEIPCPRLHLLRYDYPEGATDEPLGTASILGGIRTFHRVKAN